MEGLYVVEGGRMGGIAGRHAEAGREVPVPTLADLRVINVLACRG